MCGEAEYEECKITVDNLEWACGHCKKRRPETIHQWSLHILDLRRLQVGGYPFRGNDLSLEEWQDLGVVNETIDRMNQRQIVPVMPGMKGKG